MKPESKFRQKLDKFLHSMDPPVFYESIQQKSISGTPDKLCCIKGMFVALEIKALGGKLSKLQEYKIQKIIDSGGMAMEVNPDNFENVKYLLNGLNNQGSGEE